MWRTQNNSIVKDLSTDSQVHYPGRNKFAFAIGWVGTDVNIVQDKTYIELEIWQRHYRNNNGTIEDLSSKINYEVWGLNFPYHDKKKVKEFELDKYYCIKNEDIQIQGNYYSKDERFLQILVKRWSLNSGCKTTEEINENILASYVDILFINSYFDFEDFETPIKTYMDDTYFYELEPGRMVKATLAVKHNIAETQDGFMQLGEPSEYEFYTIGPSREYRIAETDNVLFKFSIDLGISIVSCCYQISTTFINKV